jgi:tetratricopeptide (TPR) repeat protein
MLAKKNLRLCLGLLLLLAGCMPPGPRALLEGKRLIETGKYPQAVEKLRTATALLATNAHAWNYLGLACHYAGLPAEAEKAYRNALHLNMDLSAASFNLGCLLLAENKLEPAKAALTTYTLRQGGSIEGLLKLGETQLKAGELNAAEKSLGEALRLDPRQPEALNWLGMVRLKRGRPTEAADCFSAALKQQPEYRPALLNLAIVSQENLRDPKSALQRYKQYIALKPAPVDIEAVKAVALQLERDLTPPPPPPPQQQQRPTIAVTSVQPATTAPVPKPPNTNTARVNMAPKPEPATNIPKPSLATTTAPPPQATEVMKMPAEQVIQPARDLPSTPSTNQTATAPQAASSAPLLADAKEPKHGFLQKVNPLNLFRSQDKSTLKTTPLPAPAASNAVAADSKTAGRRYDYASLTAPTAGDRAEAERAFAQGVQAQQSSRVADAEQAYSRAAQADPSFFDAHYNLGLAATAAGDLPTALRAFENALAVRPQSLDARYYFAIALNKAGYVSDAANELEKLLAKYPDEPRANLALGNLYAQQFHQPAKARQHYLKVLDADPHNSQADTIRFWLAANPPK